MLFDALIRSFNHSTQTQSIESLFEGTMENYIQCFECNNRSTRCESYNDISVFLPFFFHFLFLHLLLLFFQGNLNTHSQLLSLLIFLSALLSQMILSLNPHFSIPSSRSLFFYHQFSSFFYSVHCCGEFKFFFIIGKQFFSSCCMKF